MNKQLHALLASYKAERVRTLLTRITGDLTTTEFLRELIYWFGPDKKTGRARTRIFKHGKAWVAISRGEWEGRCGITERKYRRCVAILEDLNLIERKRMMFNGLVTPHFWLHEGMLMSLVAQALDPEMSEPIRSRCPNRFGQKETMGSVNMSESNNKGVTTETYNNAHYGADAQPPEMGGVADGADGDHGEQEQHRNNKNGNATVSMALMARLHEKNPHQKDTPVKAEDTLKKFENRPPLITANVHVDCRSRWMTETAEKTGHFVNQLTAKEQKLLKEACNAIAANTKHDPREVVAYAIRRWGPFAEAARAAAGLSTVPDEPHIGFFFKYWVHATVLMDAPADPPPVKKKPVPVAQPVAPSPEPADPDEPKLTYEETLALLKGAQQGP